MVKTAIKMAAISRRAFATHRIAAQWIKCNGDVSAPLLLDALPLVKKSVIVWFSARARAHHRIQLSYWRTTADSCSCLLHLTQTYHRKWFLLVLYSAIFLHIACMRSRIKNKKQISVFFCVFFTDCCNKMCIYFRIQPIFLSLSFKETVGES